MLHQGARNPTLYIFSGLPATGKSTLSKLVARELGAFHLRIDTIEQGLRDLCAFEVQGEGYRLAYRIAADNLRLGSSVVADSCNPIELTRREWEQVAHDTQARFFNIEVVCSDAAEHKQRAESRLSEVPGLTLPTWNEIVNLSYQPWTVDRLVIDTAGKSADECAASLIARLIQ